ncbi:pilus assembly PilX family protein [Neisseria animalis]|uniref:Pilus assembly protein PilX n=1 Tax=Neisseria animalis TaxID=492 RepID=A0A5P3MTF1_NEIAN|nr:PilX N-terminal domain-containing pilus assembly protein [Neisseria animalis]QEY24355.1 pilus assembly protein PilX [Neisseria animalis]ROW31736.1 pilus assembly protein PilX [Neisseria animalis]VEE06860.1 type IV pilus biogenesis protein PilK [Neisseria animalis]
MRQAGTLKMRKQQGFVLFIVLMVMMVVALFVVAATQSYNTEQRISANDTDRKFAQSLAQAALRAGEREVYALGRENIRFSSECAGGMCTAVGSVSPPDNLRISISGSPTVAAWERMCGNVLCVERNGKRYDVGGLNQNRDSRYIIEFIKFDAETGIEVYRVTARAKGKTANTVAWAQGYVRRRQNFVGYAEG